MNTAEDQSPTMFINIRVGIPRKTLMFINIRVGIPRKTLRPLQEISNAVGEGPSVQFNPEADNLTVLKGRIESLLSPLTTSAFLWPADQQIYIRRTFPVRLNRAHHLSIE